MSKLANQLRYMCDIMVIFDAYACYCIIWFCGICMSECVFFSFRWFWFWRKRLPSCFLFSLFRTLRHPFIYWMVSFICSISQYSHCTIHIHIHIHIYLFLARTLFHACTNTHVRKYIRTARASTWQLYASQFGCVYLFYTRAYMCVCNKDSDRKRTIAKKWKRKKYKRKITSQSTSQPASHRHTNTHRFIIQRLSMLK